MFGEQGLKVDHLAQLAGLSITVRPVDLIISRERKSDLINTKSGNDY